MALSESDAIAIVGDELMKLWAEEKTKLDRIDNWARWAHESPSSPRAAKSSEYAELVARAQAPWGDLIVSSLAQTLYVEGYRRSDAPEDVSAWALWQANGMDSRQVAIHRSALTYGVAYGVVLPGDPVPTMRGVSPRQMIAVYEDPTFDEWPLYALRVVGVRSGVNITLFDDEAVYRFRAPNATTKPELIDVTEHDVGRCPIVRWTNRVDLEGRYTGEIEPVIPLLGKIDQTSADRLIVQRFASWVVRTIAGMNKPANQSEADAQKLRLAVEDILVASNADTKFGHLPASPLSPFNESHEADVRSLSAVTQTPAHELLGTIANLSAEALAAAKASQTAKSDERKHTFGEAHEQFLRLAAHVNGDDEVAADFSAQVRWKDTEIRSLAQAADALGKLATMLGVPFELLWEKIPGFTQLDVETAKQMVAEGDSIMATLTRLAEGVDGGAVADVGAAI